MGDEHFASYLRVQYAQANQDPDPYKLSGAPTASYNSNIASSYNPAFEIGFIYSAKLINWRFGFEVIKPDDKKNMKAVDANGDPLYYESQVISAYAPKIGVEINLRQWSQTRLYLNADYGYATATVQNSYYMTSLGTSTYPSVSDFREEMKATAPLIEGSIGYETLMSDTTTFVFDAGYRSLEFTSFSHNLAVTNFQGAMSSGTAATNNNGKARSVDLSGGFISMWFRIWIQ